MWPPEREIGALPRTKLLWRHCIIELGGDRASDESALLQSIAGEIIFTLLD